MGYDINIEFIKIKDAFEKVKDDVTNLKIENNGLKKEIKTLKSTIDECLDKIKNQKEKKKENKKTFDLTKIEGIGPVIQKLLKKNKIMNFEDLSKTKVDKLKKILEDASLLHLHDPRTWPKQAQLAFEEKWVELEEWQDVLIGGK